MKRQYYFPHFTRQHGAAILRSSKPDGKGLVSVHSRPQYDVRDLHHTCAWLNGAEFPLDKMVAAELDPFLKRPR